MNQELKDKIKEDYEAHKKYWGFETDAEKCEALKYKQGLDKGAELALEIMRNAPHPTDSTK